jgi:hypothetical protein
MEHLQEIMASLVNDDVIPAELRRLLTEGLYPHYVNRRKC